MLLCFYYLSGQHKPLEQFSERWLAAPQARWDEIQTLHRSGQLNPRTTRQVLLRRGNQVIQSQILAEYQALLYLLVRYHSEITMDRERARKIAAIGASMFSGPLGDNFLAVSEQLRD